MPVIWTESTRYRLVEYENEADLEAATIQVQGSLFGQDRYYLDIKKKIGAKAPTDKVIGLQKRSASPVASRAQEDF